MKLTAVLFGIVIAALDVASAKKHETQDELASYLSVISKRNRRRHKPLELIKSPLYKEDHQDPVSPGLELMQYLYGIGSRSSSAYAAMSSPQPNRTCEEKVSCYPKLGNLLSGRESLVSASSTCGLNGPEEYCSPFAEDDCFHCDSRHDAYLYSHRVSKIIPKRRWQANEVLQRSWWQSKPGDEKVTLQIDFETRFSMWMVALYGKYAHPGRLILEHSNDFGVTWNTDIYYSTHCKKDFPHVHEVDSFSTFSSTNGVWKHPVVCVNEDRHIFPKGTVSVFRANKWNPRALNQFQEVTNIRLNFTRFPSIFESNGSVLSHPDDSEYALKRRYYTLYNLDIRGRCFCNGHAEECEPVDNSKFSGSDVVHMEVNGKCKCSHNTTADNCSQCQPGFYLPDGASISDSRPCKKCDCDERGTVTQNGTLLCSNVSNLNENSTAGQCHCKEFVSGDRCDKCVDGHHNLSLTNPQGCEKQ